MATSYKTPRRGAAGRSKQRGLALITVLMVFAIAAILVSKLALQRSIDVQRVGAMVNRSQAQYYARLGEDLAILALREEDTEDKKQGNNDIDTLEEIWTAAPYSYDIDGFSQIAIRIIDLNRFYNLNNLLEPTGVINDDELTRFENLLFELDIEQGLAENLADWLDADDRDRGFATESSGYLANELSYRAANQQLFDARELSMVEGFTPEVLEKLLPHVVALAVPEVVPLNINTASAQALASLEFIDGADPVAIGISGAQRIIEERPFANMSEITRAGINGFKSSSSAPSSAGSSSVTRARGRAAVKSNYFEINIRANYGGATAFLTSIVKQSGSGSSAKYTLLQRKESDNSARFVAE